MMNLIKCAMTHLSVIDNKLKKKKNIPSFATEADINHSVA